MAGPSQRAASRGRRGQGVSPGAGRDADDVDLLVNAGIYRDKNLGEPALAALIQEDIGANPEDPHDDTHGTFSFDITNGTCGVLSALQIVDGFLRSRAIHCALVVASDADPGHGMSEHFPFSPVGAALLCDWTDDACGLGRVYWAKIPDEGENFCATVGLIDRRNVLRFSESAVMDQQFAKAAAEAAEKCLRESSVGLTDIDAIVAAPARPATAPPSPPASEYRSSASPLPATRRCIPPPSRQHSTVG